MSASVENITTASVPRYAEEHPFNDPTADIIIRSSDNVDYRFTKALLSAASSVFRDMFGCASQAVSLSNAESRDGLAYVVVSEASIIIGPLLQLCHMGCQIPAVDIEDAHASFSAMQKYDMQGALSRSSACLYRYLGEGHNPVRVFALAHMCGSADAAKAAARKSLSLTMDERFAVWNEFREIPGNSLQEIHAYWKKCSSVASELTKNLGWIVECGLHGSLYPLFSRTDRNDSAHSTSHPGSPTCPALQRIPLRISGSSTTSDYSCYGRSWLLFYLKDMTHILEQRPTGIIAQSYDTYASSLMIAYKCGACVGSQQILQFMQFVSLLSQRVDFETAKVVASLFLFRQ